MRLKQGDHFIGFSNGSASGIYNNYGLDCSPERVRVVKIPMQYNEYGERHIIKRFEIKACQFENLKKVLVPEGMELTGVHHLPKGCVVERYSKDSDD